MKNIPIFQKIEELHDITETCQQPVLPDFLIYRNEDADKTCRQEMFLHRCNFYQVSIDLKSDYMLLHNAQKIDTTDNTIYFVGVGKSSSWKVAANKRSWKGYNINFRNDFLSAGHDNYNFCKEFPFLKIDNTRSVSISTDSQILELCERMLYEQLNKPVDTNILRHYLYLLLYHIKRLYVRQYSLPPTPPHSRQLELANRLEELIDQHYLHFKSIEEYASRLYVTPRYLSEVTKHLFGKTAKEIIMEKVLSEAKLLLVHTDLSISQIATRLDFSDTSNFIKFFKKLSGEGPSGFRKSRRFLP